MFVRVYPIFFQSAYMLNSLSTDTVSCESLQQNLVGRSVKHNLQHKQSTKNIMQLEYALIK